MFCIPSLTGVGITNGVPESSPKRGHIESRHLHFFAPLDAYKSFPYKPLHALSRGWICRKGPSGKPVAFSAGGETAVDAAAVGNPFFRKEKTGVQGFEPQLTDPESVVLPLHYTPKKPLL